jgi:hypothetical protein
MLEEGWHISQKTNPSEAADGDSETRQRRSDGARLSPKSHPVATPIALVIGGSIVGDGSISIYAALTLESSYIWHNTIAFDAVDKRCSRSDHGVCRLAACQYAIKGVSRPTIRGSGSLRQRIHSTGVFLLSHWATAIAISCCS